MNNNISATTDRNLRNVWKKDDFNSRPLTLKEIQGLMKQNRLIARLRRRAFMLFVLCCTGPFWAFLLSVIQPVSLLLQLSYCLFMLVMGAIQLYWWFQLGKIYDYMAIPMMEAQEKLEKMQKLRRNIKFTSWIIGAPVIFLLYYEIASQNNQLQLGGAIFGGIIGLIIGLTLEYLNRRQLSAVKKSFSDLMDD